MKFIEILCCLDEKNINSLFSMLKKSSCKHSKNVLLYLILGRSIFQSCSLEFGGIVRIILLNENLESLNFVGKYLKLKEKVNKQILQILIYPAFLSVLLGIVIEILRKMNFLFSSWFLLSPLLLVVLAIFLILYVKKLMRSFVLHYVLLLLYSNKIGLKSMTAVLHHFNISVMQLLNQCAHPQDISNLLIGKQIFSLEIMEEECHHSYEQISRFLSSIPQLLYGTSMITVAVVLLGVVLSIFNSQKNMLKYFV